MEELDQISQRDKLIFKNHYYKIQYALENISEKNELKKYLNAINQNEDSSAKSK